jgi:hypothetical protein
MAQRRPRPGRGERAHIGWAADVDEWTAPTRDVEASERIRPAAPRNDLLSETGGERVVASVAAASPRGSLFGQLGRRGSSHRPVAWRRECGNPSDRRSKQVEAPVRWREAMNDASLSRSARRDP